MVVITARKRSCGKVMFLQLSVILFTWGGICLSACLDTNLPGAGAPPGADTPCSKHCPRQCILGDTVNNRAVCILLECNLVLKNACALWNFYCFILTSSYEVLLGYCLWASSGIPNDCEGLKGKYGRVSNRTIIGFVKT